MSTLLKYAWLLALFLSASFAGVSQEENPFLDYKFWRGAPTVEQVKEYLKEGHSLTAVNDFGYDPLSYALRFANNTELTKFLVKKGANIHHKIKRSGRTPVFWAVYNDNLETLKFLAAQGADVNVIDESGNTLIMYAAQSGASDTGIYDFLLAKGQKLKGVTDQYGRTPLLMYAARLKDLAVVDYFVGKGLSIHATDNEGNGVFNHAARSKDIGILKGLIAKGVSIKANPKTGENAFTFATRGRGGKLTVAFLEYLKGLGLDPRAKTTQGRTCLNNIAFSEKNLAIYQFFVEHGVDPNTADQDGNIPLMRASYRGSKAIVGYLLSLTKNINQQNKDGYVALGYALRRNTPEMVAYLIANGASVKVIDQKQNDLGTQLVDSYRASDMAVFRQKMELLKANGYDPTKASVQNGNCLLQVAVRNGNLALIDEIIKMNIPINYKNDEGYTPLHVAAMTAKNDQVVKKLLASGADKTIATIFGESAYDLALENELLSANKVKIDFLK